MEELNLLEYCVYSMDELCETWMNVINAFIRNLRFTVDLAHRIRSLDVVTARVEKWEVV